MDHRTIDPSAADARRLDVNRTEEQLNRIERACLEKGLRMTEQRRVIARVVADAYDHPDAEELYRRAVAVDPHISIATVYRTVKLFEDAGDSRAARFSGRAVTL